MAGTASAAERCAISVLENDAGELLFLRRAPHARLGPGQWGFPAGHIEAHETPAQCAARELDEEIGPDHRLSLRRVLGPVRDRAFGGRYEVWLFHYRWHGGRIRLNPEHTASAWVDARRWRALDVVPGVDEDLEHLGLWPETRRAAT